MAGILETAWWSGRSTHEGYADFKVTVYWRHGGMRGGTGVRMVREYAAVPGSRTVGPLRGCMEVLGCPPDPSNNSGGT